MIALGSILVGWGYHILKNPATASLRAETSANEKYELKHKLHGKSRVPNPLSRRDALVVLTVTAVAAITLLNPIAQVNISSAHVTSDKKAIGSKFKNTVAFISIQKDLPGLEDSLRKAYSPLFHTVHISLPPNADEKLSAQSTVTKDRRSKASEQYMNVHSILKGTGSSSNFSDVDGILSFQSDSFINPLYFSKLDASKIWSLGDTTCLYYDAKSHNSAHALLLQANIEVVRMGLYVVDPNKLCSGLPDIYFLPRQYFRDFINIAATYGGREQPIESSFALPTIWNILDQTQSPSQINPSIVLRLNNCKTMTGYLDDVLEADCGYGMDLNNARARELYFGAIHEAQKILTTRE
jgi:hypothetical protein